ncbi:MAG: hypothetical protein VB112_04715, partial [Oscillospiraceae bacterium]|nr:hypothetical protein [Oscillospiraceae bacterium]
MKKRWIPLLLFFVLLAGCGSSSTSQTPDFNTFIREVNDARANNMAWTEDENNDLAAYTPDFSDQMDAFTQEEMDQLVTPHENPGTITLEEAKQDVDTFFKIIQTTYGGYEYFGGDEVFLPIRDKVKADLEQETVLDAEALET